MGLGGEDNRDTKARIAQKDPISEQAIVDALTSVMRQEAFNHKYLQAIDGRLPNGMCIMAMTAHTGCLTVPCPEAWSTAPSVHRVHS
jgi:pyruvate-ferredoxin/flavodoxin oxidoreductase